MVEAWREVDVSEWPVEVEEPRGKRPKFWVKSPGGVLWLRKEPRARSPAEPAIESLMLRLARAVGLPAPDSAACTWQTASGGWQRGILVRIFLEQGEELSIGSVELRADDAEYDPEHKGMHTLARIRHVLTALESLAGRRVLEPFAHMLAFDAWIGNGDRHQENWAVLRLDGRPTRLAPIFDVASCLGVELSAGHRNFEPAADLAPYIENCPSGFGNGTDRWPLLSMWSVVDTVSAWPEWRAGIQAWLADFASTMDTFEQVVCRVPVDWLPPERAALACKLLRTRLEWLQRRSG
jgi:hypothetical protein